MTSSTDRIEQKVYLAAAPERVWRALSEANEFMQWFGVALDGGFAERETVHMVWKDQRYPIEIVEMTAPQRLVWKWHPGAHDNAVDYAQEPMTTTVFDLEAHGEGTMLTVVESGFDAIGASRRASVLKDNVNGWLAQAKSLKEYLDAG